MDRVPFAGELDKQIQVYKVEFVPDELSDHKPVDVLVCNARAKLQDLSSSQEVEGAVVSVMNRSYTIRRNPEIATGGLKMHIVHNGVTYGIQSIKEIDRSHLQLIVKGYE